jgi:hypothetical protein
LRKPVCAPRSFGAPLGHLAVCLSLGLKDFFSSLNEQVEYLRATFAVAQLNDFAPQVSEPFD